MIKNHSLVAVIIPVYNDEEYINKSLDSIKNQTVDFWEAWLIDDASTDGSLDIIKRYCEEDSRFHYLCNETNSSAWVSRAKGILAASDTVKYIMFADADDSLELNAIERAYKLMEEDPVDILHFGTNVINYSDKSKSDIENYSKYLQPPLEKISGKNVFDSFIQRKFEGHLWNKMFRADLLKAVINDFGADRILPKAQDKVLYWATCWQKPDITYRGVPDKLYNYSYGQGVEGNTNTFTLTQYRQYLAQAWTEDAIAEIMEQHNAVNEYSDALNNSRNNMILHSVKNFFKLAENDKSEGLHLLNEYWNNKLDPARIVCSLARLTWNERDDFLKLAANSEMFRTTKTSKDIKVIGTYYHRMDNGGIQRVIAQLIPIWHDMGYEVVLFTDNEKGANDYLIPDYVSRVTIGRPSSKCNEKNYYDRGFSFAKLIAEHNVDCMIYHSYFSDVLEYDMGICKAMDVPFIIYEHNVFTRFLRYNDPKFTTIPKCARIADGIVCLDDTSAEWWQCFNSNSCKILNPLSFPLANTIPPRANKNILFLCRLEEAAKRPNDAITIMRELVKIMPDAVLYVVGSGQKQYIDRLHKRIEKLGLQDNIIMCGFQMNVEEYYEKCSVFLSCSSHEGAPMTLCEALHNSTPIVMYDLPYLEIVKDNPGIISVPQKDINAAVDALYNLLNSPDDIQRRGIQGRQYLEKMYSIDFANQWCKVFDSINNDTKTPLSQNIKMADTIISDYLDGLEQSSKEIQELKRMNTEITQELKITQRKLKHCSSDLHNIRNSVSFKVGRVITFIPRKIRDILKKLLKKK